jgi:hypothetical protein
MRANIKIGLAFAGAAGLGGLLILTQFMTLGWLTLAAAGGGLGGYLLRIRQGKGKLHLAKKDQDTQPVTKVTTTKTKQLRRIETPQVIDKK